MVDAAIYKIAKSDISSIVSQILIKFGATITPTLIPCQCIHGGKTPQKGFIFLYSSPQNSDKSTNNCFRAKCVKYSNFYNIFAIV